MHLSAPRRLLPIVPLCLCASVPFLLPACQAGPAPVTRTLAGTTAADTELRDTLKQLSKFHIDRGRLALYVSLPFHHKLSPDIRAVVDFMAARNREILAELQAYAKMQSVDLAFKYEPDIFSQAQFAMDKLQGDNLQASKEDYEPLLVFILYIDHSFGKVLIETILRQTKDLDLPLKAILERDLAMHNDVLARVMPLMRRLKFGS